MLDPKTGLRNGHKAPRRERPSRSAAVHEGRLGQVAIATQTRQETRTSVVIGKLWMPGLPLVDPALGCSKLGHYRDCSLRGFCIRLGCERLVLSSLSPLPGRLPQRCFSHEVVIAPCRGRKPPVACPIKPRAPEGAID